MKLTTLLASTCALPLLYCAQQPRHHGEPTPHVQPGVPMHGGHAAQDGPGPAPRQAHDGGRRSQDGPRGGNHDELRVLRDQLRETAHSMLRQADEIDRILGGSGPGPRDPHARHAPDRAPRAPHPDAGPRQGPDPFHQGHENHGFAPPPVQPAPPVPPPAPKKNRA